MVSSPRPYSRLERLLHDVAFRTAFAQRIVGDIEDQIFARQLGSAEVARPVFIASLPRAGTTLLLELLSALPDFASHTYRDMPFVLTPLFWDRISQRFRRTAETRERAHGDGVRIGFDSPEAFEEIIWMASWREKYGGDRIATWTDKDRNPDFEAFFRNHIRKIVALRMAGGPSGAAPRYVSKNNANIARLALLSKLFPDCTVLVPIRDPAAHARSLRNQHRRFGAMHAQDDFSRRYMAGIGHFEFGQNLKPIDFNNWLDRAGPKDPGTLDYWLRYWIEAAEAVLATAGPNVTFVDYDQLCAAPEPSLTALAAAIGLADPSPMIRLAGRIRPSARPTGDPGTVADSPLARDAARLHEDLRHQTRSSQASLEGHA